MVVRAIKGAIHLDIDDRSQLLKSTAELLAKMLHANKLDNDSLISIMFSATADLTSDFPALAAQDLELNDVPVMCFTEMQVPGAMPRVVRIMVHANLDLPRSEVQHVYLRGAQELRAGVGR